MGKSGLLQRQADRENAVMHAAEMLSKQYMVDTLQITLNKKEGWGYDRIVRLCEEWEETRQEYRKALNPKDPEADVEQEHMDMAISRIINGRMELIPFYERYPDLKKVRY